MSDNVVAFPKREIAVWVCGCGCTTHYHHANGDVECASCGNIACDNCMGQWRERLPETPAEIKPTDAECFKVTRLDTEGAALKRVLGGVIHEQTSAVIVIGTDGALSCWGRGFKTKAEQAWLRRHLASAFRRLI